MKRVRTSIVIALAGVTALGALAGPVLATPPTPAGGRAWVPNQVVGFRWNADKLPPQWLRPALLAAASDSNSSSAARAAVFTLDPNANSWFGYTSDIPSTYAIAYAVAAQPWWFKVRLRPQGYMLDWGRLRWCQFYDDPPGGCYDAELIALHELGHVQSLGHPAEAGVTAWLDTVMHAAPKSKSRIGWNAHEFGRCDGARLQIVYGSLTTSTPYSDCLSLPTELSLSASATSIAAGNKVTFSARLKVASDVTWRSLAGQPLDGRTVVLQRRAVGTLTWTTVAQMAPGAIAGSYVKTQAINATNEWRAYFPPPDEGLQRSGSGLLRVSVSGGTACSPSTDFDVIVC